MEKSLNNILESLYSLVFAAQQVHWNVSGPCFYRVHNISEDIYQFAFKAVDDVAERMKQLGCDVFVPSYQRKEFEKGCEYCIQLLIKELEILEMELKRVVTLDDDVTQDLITSLKGKTQKQIWMLKESSAQ